MIFMNNNENNNMINPKLVELLSTIDKSKIEQVSKMVQNMSSQDLNKIMNMLTNNNNSNN